MPAPAPARALPSFSQVAAGPAYDHDPPTHHQQHSCSPTPPLCLASEERTSHGPISIIWAHGPYPLAQDVCIGQQPAAGGLGLHIPPLVFAPFRWTPYATVGGFCLQGTPLLHRQGP